MTTTMVQLRKSTVDRLKRLKSYPRQTYDEMINDILDAQEEKLTPDELAQIEESLAQMKAGDTISIEELAKKYNLRL
jgi:predicted transcriptional regulator